MSIWQIIAANIVFGLVSWVVIRALGRLLPKGGEDALWCGLSMGLFALQGLTAFGIFNLCIGLLCGYEAVRAFRRGYA